MASMNRADTINSLALAMGVNAPKVYDTKRYDSKTGTIYCNDKPVSKDSLSNAIHYFEALKAKYARTDSAEFRTVCNYYDIAISAMKVAQEQTILETGSKLAM